jgi:N-acetylglucosamine-6-phosphate deacetylase
MAANPGRVLLRNARAVLPDGVAESVTVAIENGIITDIASKSEVDEQAHQIDGSDLTLFPGFIDIHIHGSVGVDTTDADANGLALVSQFLVGCGVTGWVPTLVPADREQYASAVRAINESMHTNDVLESPPHARALGVHYEGPFVNSLQCGALHVPHFRRFASSADLDDLPTIQHDKAVHMMTLAPEIDGGIALIKELRQRGWIVSIGHTRAPDDILHEALAAGAKHMTHFMNAMTGLHHRTIGAVGWGLVHDEVTFDIIADGVHIDSEILKLLVRSKTPERVSLISDAIAAAGRGDGDYQIWGEIISVKNGQTQNAAGSIAGSVISVLDAVRMMLSLGFSESEVAAMASANPARLLGIDAECGSIEVGKRADLVGLAQDREVALTIVEGRIAYDAR